MESLRSSLREARELLAMYRERIACLEEQLRACSVASAFETTAEGVPSTCDVVKAVMKRAVAYKGLHPEASTVADDVVALGDMLLSRLRYEEGN